MKAIIPVAGQGTRFMPYTKAAPKELVPVGDRPLVHHVVDECLDAGATEIVLVTSPQKRSIEDYFTRDDALVADLDASGRRHLLEPLERVATEATLRFVPQIGASGSGAAVVSAAAEIGDDPFLLLWGDELILAAESRAVQLLQAFAICDGPVVGLQPVAPSDVSSYGIAAVGEEVAGGIVRLVDLIEKPAADEAPSSLAATGGYVMTPAILPVLAELAAAAPEQELHLTDGIRALMRTTPVYGVVLTGQYLDFGNPGRYLRSVVQLGLADPGSGAEFAAYLRALLAIEAVDTA